MPKTLSTISETAIAYRVSERTVRRWIASGLLTAYRTGPHLVRIDTNDVGALLRRIPTVRDAS